MSIRPKFQETALNFRKPNEEFSVLQNVRFGLRTTDGDFADIDAVAIRKRYGTEKIGNEISDTGEIHTLLSYTNNTKDYLISGHDQDLYTFVEDELNGQITTASTTILLADATDFSTSGTIWIDDNEIDYTGKSTNTLTGCSGIAKTHADEARVIQRVWKSIKGSLTAGEHFTGAVMDSYSGTATVTSDIELEHIGTWTNVVFDPVQGMTILHDTATSPTWKADQLIGRWVTINTGDYEDLEYQIVENSTTYIKIEGDVLGLTTTTVDDIAVEDTAAAVTAAATTITLDSVADFRTSGGTASLEGDVFTYTGKSGVTLTGCTNIDINHADNSVCASGEVTLTSVKNLDSNGWITIGDYQMYYNGISGKKLLGLSNVENSISAGAVVTNANAKTAIGKAYSIKFISVSTRVVDTTKSWTDDQYVGYTVVIYEGLGAGQQRVITSNYKDYLEVAFSWEEEPDDTSKYKIYENTDQVFYMGNKTDGYHRFDGETVTAITSAPKGDIILNYQSRIFIAKDYSVNYCDVGDPEYFPSIFSITPPGDDKITGLAEWNGNGIIFKENSIWKFNFTFNDTTAMWDIDLVQIPSNSGCISHRTIQKVENVLWYFDGKAVKYLGASPNQIGVIRTEDISFPIYQDLKKMPEDTRENAVAIYDGDTYLMFGTKQALDEYNNIGYNYDTSFTGWCTRTGNNASSVVIHNNVRYYGDSAKGQVHTMDIEDSYLDDETPVDMIVATKDTDLGNPSLFKTIRFGIFEFENEDSSAEYESKVYTTKYTLTREGEWDIGFGLEAEAELGEAWLGGAVMGGGAESPRRILRKVSMGFQGIRVQHILRNQKDEKLSITNISTIWYVRSMRHFPTSLIN